MNGQQIGVAQGWVGGYISSSSPSSSSFIITLIISIIMIIIIIIIIIFVSNETHAQAAPRLPLLYVALRRRPCAIVLRIVSQFLSCSSATLPTRGCLPLCRRQQVQFYNGTLTRIVCAEIQIHVPNGFWFRQQVISWHMWGLSCPNCGLQLPFRNVDL